MIRSWPKTPAVLGLLLAVPLLAAVGLAWACVPTARVALSKDSGDGNVTVTMSGSGFPANAQTVDIYLDVKNTGQKLNPSIVNMTGGDERSFSTQITMPSAVGSHLLIPVPRDVNGADVGTTSQGAGPPAAVYQVTDPGIAAAPGSARAGTPVTVTGTNFRFGTVDLHWDSAAGPNLGSVQTAATFGFAKKVTIPSTPAGAHSIVAVPLGDPADSASTALTVLPPLPAIVPAPDNVGPAIAAAALSSKNGTMTPKRGVVTVFCGDYDEAGVTGECGASSVKKIKVAGASKSAVLKLGTKSFSAGPGKPGKVKFRLKRSAMKMLKKAKKVRMRGTVLARDSKGNASPKATFKFTLKAPKTRKK